MQSADRKIVFCTNLLSLFQESFGNLKHYRPYGSPRLFFAFGGRSSRAIRSFLISLLLTSIGVSHPARAQQTTPRSATAQAAFDYLVRYLNVENVQYGGHLESTNGDICSIKAVESYGFAASGLVKVTFGIAIADLDLDSPTVQAGEIRTLHVTSAKGKMFSASIYDNGKKKWNEFKKVDEADFLIGGGNENAVLRAIATLAKECGAKPNGF